MSGIYIRVQPSSKKSQLERIKIRKGRVKHEAATARQSVPRRERQHVVLVCIVDGRVQVYGDGVISRDLGGKVH